MAAQPLVRAGISRLLAWAGSGLSVVGEAATVGEVATARADVVVVAADAAGAAEIGRLGPAVVAVCPPGDHQLVVELLQAGVHGCVESTADGAALARAVIAASLGESLVPRGGRAVDALTAREREVRALVQQGLTDRAIAERLVIAVKTVEKHVGAVLRKTGVHSRAELIVATMGSTVGGSARTATTGSAGES